MDIKAPPPLKGGRAARGGQVVGDFNPPLDAIHRGVRFASEIRISRDIHCDLGATRKLRKTEVQATAGALHAEFVESRAADGGLVLEGKAAVARLVKAGTSAGILTEELVLRSVGWTKYEKWATAPAR